MKLFTLTLAAAALGMTGFAYAGDAGGHAAAIKAPTMLTNSQMAKVVAGYAPQTTETDTLVAPSGLTQTVGDVTADRPLSGNQPSSDSAYFCLSGTSC